MAAASVNIVIEKGTDFSESFAITNYDGSIVPLTGCSAISKLKKYPESNTSYSFSTVVNQSSGEIVISMGNTTTNSLDPGRYYYDIVVINPDTTKTRVVEGMVLLTPSVST
jgi:hypothetical protein